MDWIGWVSNYVSKVEQETKLNKTMHKKRVFDSRNSFNQSSVLPLGKLQYGICFEMKFETFVLSFSSLLENGCSNQNHQNQFARESE